MAHETIRVEVDVAGLVKTLSEQIATAFTQEPELQGTANDRERYAASLASIAQFLAKLNSPFADRFFELAAAIADMNEGKRNPLFVPAFIDNRPGGGTALWLKRARAAATLHALISSGLTTKCAAKQVAHNVQSDLANATPMRLIRWRYEFLAGRVQHAEAATLFAEAKAKIDAANAFDLAAMIARDPIAKDT